MKSNHLYTNEIIARTLRTDLVIDNAIKGVFGEVVNVFQVPRDNPEEPNIITIERKKEEYQFTYNFVEIGETSNGGLNRRFADALTEYSGNFSYGLTFTYKTPFVNQSDVRVSAQLVCRRRGIWSSSALGMTPTINEVINFVRSNQENFSENILMGQGDVPQPSWSVFSQGILQEGEERIEFDVTNIRVGGFSVEFEALLNMNLNGRLFSDITTGSANFAGIDIIVWEPLYIEVKVNADIFNIVPQAFQHGEKTHTHEIKRNTLLTTNSMVNDPVKGVVPLHEDLSWGIIDEWKDGKQVVRLTIVLDSDKDLRYCEQAVYVFNCPRGTFDENDQAAINKYSIARYKSGVAKKFTIVGAHFLYERGATTQQLILQERREGK